MICGFSLVNLEGWHNEEIEKSDEVILSVIDKLKKEEEISLLDFAPEFKKILRDKTYGLWSPPGSIRNFLLSPKLNLANMLNKEKPVPSILIVPINVHRSKAEFIKGYGLVPEKGGLSYDTFLQEIREGRILPIIIEIPAHYRADFYQDIVKACEQGEIQQLTPI